MCNILYIDDVYLYWYICENIYCLKIRRIYWCIWIYNILYKIFIIINVLFIIEKDGIDISLDGNKPKDFDSMKAK